MMNKMITATLMLLFLVGMSPQSGAESYQCDINGKKITSSIPCGDIPQALQKAEARKAAGCTCQEGCKHKGRQCAAHGQAQTGDKAGKCTCQGEGPCKADCACQGKCGCKGCQCKKK